MKSMTGFGRAQCAQGSLQCSVEVSSVNRKNLDVQVALPRERSALEPVVVKAVRKFCDRGRVQVRVSFETSESQDVRFDEEKLAGELAAVNQLAERLGVSGISSIRELFSIPGLQVARSAESDSEVDAGALVSKAVEDALTGLVEMRETEGEVLAAVLTDMVKRMLNLVSGLQERTQISRSAVREKLLKGLEEIGAEGLSEDQRLLQEIAFYGERADITEEVDRLGSHLKQLEEKMGASEPLGRSFDFIGQEIAREVNTVCSKSQDLQLTRDALALKEIVDQFREQCLNVE